MTNMTAPPGNMIDGLTASDNAPTGHRERGADSSAVVAVDRIPNLLSSAGAEINPGAIELGRMKAPRWRRSPEVDGSDERERQPNKVDNSFSGPGAEFQGAQHQAGHQRQQPKLQQLKQQPSEMGTPNEPLTRTVGSPVAPVASLAGYTTMERRSKLKCRLEKDLYLELETYQHNTCATCYKQVPPEYFYNKLGLVKEEDQMVRLVDQESKQLIWTNETVRIRRTFKTEEKFEKWRLCCRQAVECCVENAKYLPSNADDEKPLVDDPGRSECPGTWDGLSCWGPSPPGRLATRECPRVAYLLDFEPACRGYITKQCFKNASWFINRYGHEWSDYSTCSPEGLYKARMLHASLAYVCESLIVVPALLMIGKFQHRGGNKRLRIMKSLLFYILLNSLIQALQRGFLAAGYFSEYRASPPRAQQQSSSLRQSQQQQQLPPTPPPPQQQRQQEQSAVPRKLAPILANGTDDASSLVGTHDELILKAISQASLPNGTRGDADSLQQWRRHARSANHPSGPNATTTSGVVVENNYADKNEDNDYDVDESERDQDEEDDLDGDNDNDDEEDGNELVKRIFVTAPNRQQSTPAFGLNNEGTRQARIDKSNSLRNDATVKQPSWLNKRLEIAGTIRRPEAINKKALGQADKDISSRYQLKSPDGANSKPNNSTEKEPKTRYDQDQEQEQHDCRIRYTQVPNKPVADTPTTTTQTKRLKRNSTLTLTNSSKPQEFKSQITRNRRTDSTWKAFFCWFLQMTGRLVRLMSYAWMFTGGVYLCSALHFAPAEPPANFIKILFFLTNAFPILIFFTYVTARTINEPSPLNIVIKGPYYWYYGDDIQVEQLYETQRVCWFEESKSQSIEDIADLPNLILVASNVALFVITLIILCRINRPGSTRPDMSPCAYFKAAGTLLFLYGGHYFFLAYRPESQKCSVDTFMFYAFICTDVVQGIAISIVFCYMTQEGKSVIIKYWRNKHRFTPFKQISWLSCFDDKYKLADNGYHHTPYNNIRLNHSTRSNTSACNGHNDNVTELVNINETQESGHF